MQFLKVFLETWDGKKRREVVIEILAFAPVTEFNGKQWWPGGNTLVKMSICANYRKNCIRKSSSL